VGNFESSLTTLEKLSKTDPELLQKYSKVFFLNEHYTPERVSEIEKEYLYNENEPEQIHASVRPYLEDLLNEAGSDGIELYVLSAYRSFDEQWALKGVYTVTYGAGTANTFSADQGYSEHQLGTAVDFITTGLGGGLSGFENTAAYEWLLKNAHKHGFTLSYPRENAYYIFEPWHWRFVGVELATYLHNRGKYFYDLEQREIDEYLVEIFD
jgi:D-alanyl-D-alanine carboxypeptidase